MYKTVSPALDSVDVCSIAQFARAMFIGEKLVFEMRDLVIPINSKSMASSLRSAWSWSISFEREQTLWWYIERLFDFMLPGILQKYTGPRTTEISWWRTTETSLGVSFETYLRRRGDILMGRRHYVPLRRLHDIPIRRRETNQWDVVGCFIWDVPAALLGLKRDIVTTLPRGLVAGWVMAENLLKPANEVIIIKRPTISSLKKVVNGKTSIQKRMFEEKIFCEKYSGPVEQWEQ